MIVANALRLPYADGIADAIVTDPPYHLTQASRGGSPRTNDPETPFGRTRLGSAGFMGKTWDGGDVATRPEAWAEALRVAKPGAHLVAFGGTRTHHRLMCALEDAGWEIRDCLMWVYGSGFPKSLDVSKAIDKAAGAERETVGGGKGRTGKAAQPHGGSVHSDDNYQWPGEFDITAPATEAAKRWEGWGTALKPAWEPIILARKPLTGTVAANTLEHGTGGLNVDGCRVGTEDVRRTQNADGMLKFSGANPRPHHQNVTPKTTGSPKGRWPANVVHDGSEEVLAGFPETKSAGNVGNSDVTAGASIFGIGDCGPRNPSIEGDRGGSAARFFPSLGYSEDELLFHRAKTILDAWNPDLASIADLPSGQRKGAAASVLSDAVILASQGATQSSGWRGLSTIGTRSELRRACVSAIALTLSLDSERLPARLPVAPIPTQGPAKSAEQSPPTGTTTTTRNRKRSGGDVVSATFEATQPNTAPGDPDSPRRFRYCAKASRSERGEGNDHPTVKPVALMRWLVRLVCPVGGLVVDPFAGSFSTAEAVMAERSNCAASDKELPYALIGERRLSDHRAVKRGEGLPPRRAQTIEGPLFEGIL